MERFKRADANKDGKVTLNEVPEQRREFFKRLLAKADKDKDQALSADEAKAAVAAFRKRMHAATAARVGVMAQKIFTRLDADKDGKVTLSEVPEDHRDRFQRLLARADKDKDKALSAKEAKAAAAVMRQRIRCKVEAQKPGAEKHKAEKHKAEKTKAEKAEAKKARKAKKAREKKDKKAKVKKDKKAKKHKKAKKTKAEQPQAEKPDSEN